MPPRTVQNPNPNRASRSAVAAECGGDAADEDAAEAQNASEARAVEAVQRPDVIAAARAAEPARLNSVQSLSKCRLVVPVFWPLPVVPVIFDHFQSFSSGKRNNASLGSFSYFCPFPSFSMSFQSSLFRFKAFSFRLIVWPVSMSFFGRRRSPSHSLNDSVIPGRSRITDEKSMKRTFDSVVN